MEEEPPTTLLKSSELGLLKKIIRGIPDGQGVGIDEA
jgi:hypothetical protein